MDGDNASPATSMGGVWAGGIWDAVLRSTAGVNAMGDDTSSGLEKPSTAFALPLSGLGTSLPAASSVVAAFTASTVFFWISFRRWEIRSDTLGVR